MRHTWDDDQLHVSNMKSTCLRSETVHEVRWQLINEVSKKQGNIRKNSEIVS